MKKFTAEHRNEKVLEVLREAIGPMAPTQIARIIGEEWCCYEGKREYAHSSAVSAVLKRIGAVGVKGKWSLPK